MYSTHSLGFFLGPGLPRSRMGALGSMDGGALLRPVTAAPPLFFRPSILGGASELGSAASLVVGGIGVALESEALSTTSCCTDGDGSACGFADGLAAGYRARLSGDRRSVTILLFFAGLGVDLVVVDDMVGGGGRRCRGGESVKGLQASQRDLVCARG